MRPVDSWPPLRGLGVEAATAIERALACETSASVAQAIAVHEARGSTNDQVAAALCAARLALALRSGDAPALTEAHARETAEKLLAAGDAQGAAWVEVERAALLVPQRDRLAEATLLAEALPTPVELPALASASMRVRGAIARARGDLDIALASLEQAQALAFAAGSTREILRSLNTLGATYASLGAAPLARDALDRARELAELTRQHASAAIAAGQLAVLALDAGRPSLAVRHLQAQCSLAEQISDVHGRARALALLVEAHSVAHDAREARAAAAESRALYSSTPTSWTREQALMATLYETEAAFEAGDLERARELATACVAERASDAPAARLVRARGAFCELWEAIASLQTDPYATADRAFAALRGSPRPAWVERLLSLAARSFAQRGLDSESETLAARAAWVAEARAAASAPNLVALRRSYPALAIARAAARGRDLVDRARLALAPTRPFDAHVLVIDLDSRRCAGQSIRSFPAAGDVWWLSEGSDRCVAVATTAEAIDRVVSTVTAVSSVRAMRRAQGIARAVIDPMHDLTLVGPACDVARASTPFSP